MAPPIWPSHLLLPGMRPHAIRRNVLVMLVYVVLVLFLSGLIVRIIEMG